MKLIARTLAFAAAASISAAPCLAADPRLDFETGERHSSASAGLYFAVPFGGARNGRPQGGLRLRMTHDYRSPASPQARVVNADTLELRLIGEERPTLFVADRPITGRDDRQNMMGGGIVTIVVIGLAVVGAVVVYSAIHDDDDEAVPN
jgi:hypothetical protein